METYIVYPNQEQEKVVKAFLEALDISFIKANEELPQHVIQGVLKGQEDVRMGRTISLEDFKSRLSANK